MFPHWRCQNPRSKKLLQILTKGTRTTLVMRKVASARYSRGSWQEKCSREKASMLRRQLPTSPKTMSSKWLRSNERLPSTQDLHLRYVVASKTSTMSTITERLRLWKRETKESDSRSVIGKILRKEISNKTRSRAILSQWFSRTKTKPNIGLKTRTALTVNDTTRTFTLVTQHYRRFLNLNSNRLRNFRLSMCPDTISWVDKSLTLTWILPIPSTT